MSNRDKKEYSNIAMKALSSAIKRDDEAFDWLMANDNKELAALTDVLIYGNQEAMDWLKNNHFNNLVSFVGALDEDEDAIIYLMTNEGKNWAATAEMVNGSESAPGWLHKFFPSYGAFADALISCASHGGGMGGFSGSGGSVGGGFGGFGGGSFGGGGGGGKW